MKSEEEIREYLEIAKDLHGRFESQPDAHSPEIPDAAALRIHMAGIIRALGLVLGTENALTDRLD